MKQKLWSTIEIGWRLPQDLIVWANVLGEPDLLEYYLTFLKYQYKWPWKFSLEDIIKDSKKFLLVSGNECKKETSKSKDDEEPNFRLFLHHSILQMNSKSCSYES